jgi:hypothetical protein
VVSYRRNSPQIVADLRYGLLKQILKLQHGWHAACFDVHHEARDGFHGNAAGSSLFSAAAEATDRIPVAFFLTFFDWERKST